MQFKKPRRQDLLLIVWCVCVSAQALDVDRSVLYKMKKSVKAIHASGLGKSHFQLFFFKLITWTKVGIVHLPHFIFRNPFLTVQMVLDFLPLDLERESCLCVLVPVAGWVLQPSFVTPAW